MRILLCNTSESTGGAAIAARRLMVALRRAGEDVRMVVRDRAADSDVGVLTPACPKLCLKAKFVAERVGILRANRWRRHRLFEVDSATCGTDLTRLPAFRQADVLHLHWVNQGMVSLKGIAEVLQSGKPVVWTLHDMWPLTGICHHARDCRGWLHGCGNCPILYKGSPRDLSCRTYQRKQAAYGTAPMHFVACSDWLADIARRAPLLRGHTVHSIPNPIDTAFYTPADPAAARREAGRPAGGDILLFLAYKATDPNKGIAYLRQALERLVAAKPEMRRALHLVVVGRGGATLAGTFAVPATTVDYLADPDAVRRLYRAATLLMTPTLQDNLPNTIVEAMACGVPTVGFRVGGLPQLIAHRENGYLADYKDAADLARGIAETLQPAVRRRYAEACRRRAEQNFSMPAVAASYQAVYRQAVKHV